MRADGTEVHAQDLSQPNMGIIDRISNLLVVHSIVSTQLNSDIYVQQGLSHQLLKNQKQLFVLCFGF